MRLKGVFWVVLGVLCTGQAKAQSLPYDWEWWLDPMTSVRVQSSGDWRLNVGGNVVLAPDYHGSGDLEPFLVPLIDLEFRGTFFASTARGIGINLFKSHNVRAGFRITPDYGRDADDNDNLSTLDDIDPTAEAGFFAEALLGRWRWRADIRKAVSSHEGLTASAGVAYGARMSNESSFFLRTRIRYADDDYMRAYFGVRPSETRPGFNAYNAEAGFLDANIGASVVWHFLDRAYASFDLTGGTVMGDAVDSPITEEEYYATAGVGLGYHF